MFPKRVVTQLFKAKSNEGACVASVSPKGNNSQNPAWVRMVAKGENRDEGFELEYLELKGDYDEETSGSDWDYFLVENKYWYCPTLECLEEKISVLLVDLETLVPEFRSTFPK